MTNTENTRQSLCCVCGKRLSTKTAEGEIRWETSQLGDKGLYCETCAPKPKGKGKKN